MWSLRVALGAHITVNTPSCWCIIVAKNLGCFAHEEEFFNNFFGGAFSLSQGAGMELIQHPAVQVVQVEQRRLKQPVAPSSVPSSGRKPDLPQRWEKLLYET